MWRRRDGDDGDSKGCGCEVGSLPYRALCLPSATLSFAPHPFSRPCLPPQPGYSLTLTLADSDRFLNDKLDILEVGGRGKGCRWGLMR